MKNENSQKDTENDCVFCKLASGEIPRTAIFEDADTVAFLSTGPINPGHTLLIPKKHFANIYELSDDVAAKLGVNLKKLSKSIKDAMKANGINIMMNNDRAAGQAVFHAHFHIIPRFSGDGLQNWEHSKSYKKGEADEITERIRAEVNKI